ncbi:MAG: biopolymer transporter ExbD [Alphaproteobacteria bacterium]|nr:biopolymer transporter ExbD [Alphaproteobacteria bacterium]MCB9696828.1 biopolymer transporter ExbD [Alphaproteobacteria bacterium]
MIAAINITPFVDIILVVLIIFMVTATTIVKQSIKISLPEAASGEATEDTSLGLTLTKEGELLLDGQPTDADGVRAAIRAARGTGKDVVCLISADKAVAHGRLVWAIDLVKSEGVGKFAINIDKTQAIPPDPATTGLGSVPVPGG